MSEAAKVRLVRCPKCENLLPEVTDYSVYQCGGCGAVLRAKNKGVDLDTFSEKSDEGRVESTVGKHSDSYEKTMNVSAKRMMEASDGSESDVRSTVSSSSRAERRRNFRDRAEHSRTSLTSKEEKIDDKADLNLIQDKKSDELQPSMISQGLENLEINHENENGFRRPGRLVDGRNVEKNENNGSSRAQRTIDAEVMRYAKEGLPNFQPRSGYDYENPSRSGSDLDGFSNVELLKKLDELKEQLSRSGNLTDKGKETSPFDRRMAHQDPYASLEMVHNSYPDRQFKRPPPYQNEYVEPLPMMHRQEMGGNGFYPPRYGPSYGQGYVDPSSRSHMHRRGPYEAPIPYQMSASHSYASGSYRDDGMVYMDNNMEPYPPNFSHHHPSCSCYQCRDKRQVSTPILPPAYSDKYSDVSSFGSRDYNQRISNNHSLGSRNAQSHTRWPSDVNSEVDGFIPHRPPRVVPLASSGKHCRSIAGGAPLFSCYNCFEVLLLPKKAMNNNNSRNKMRCGACSTVIVFAVSKKNLVVSFDVESKDDNIKVESKHKAVSIRGEGHLNQARTTFSSDDYYDNNNNNNNSGYDFHSMDREVAQASIGEEDVGSLTAVGKGPNSADMAKEDKEVPPSAGSSLQDYFEYSNKYRVVKRDGEGNKSGRSEHEKVLLNKSADQKFLRKESSATEIDLSSNEYSNTGTTFDSGEASRDGNNLKVAKSIFAGFPSSGRTNESFGQEHANVTVNGHLISDRLIKKAEKLAGPIEPGHYWYDFRAGFWGAMGGPCLGIIPPFIEEFNFPMPEHCAGGNTQVFVNGRELNQKDMNLLGSRGLPRESDRSYIVEISGRVLDEDTGEELESLGKLAPTVERVKHGFGMRLPKAVA